MSKILGRSKGNEFFEFMNYSRWTKKGKAITGAEDEYTLKKYK